MNGKEKCSISVFFTIHILSYPHPWTFCFQIRKYNKSKKIKPTTDNSMYKNHLDVNKNLHNQKDFHEHTSSLAVEMQERKKRKIEEYADIHVWRARTVEGNAGRHFFGNQFV